MNADEICLAVSRAFCGEIEVHEVPAGFAVKTAFQMEDGDYLSFFIIQNENSHYFSLEDTGLIVPYLESTGIDISKGARREVFKTLLNEYDASYDDDSMEIKINDIHFENLSKSIVRFVALLLRVQDLSLLKSEIIESTFKEDAINSICDYFKNRIDLKFNASPIEDSNDYRADVILSNKENIVALYIGASNAKVDEAVMVWQEGQILGTSYQVAILYETETRPNISNISYRRAQNRVESTIVFRNEEHSAMAKLERMLKLDSHPRLH